MLTTSLLLIFPLHLCPLPQEDSGATYQATSRADAAATAEHVEIFRRLLSRGLGKISARRTEDFLNGGRIAFSVGGLGGSSHSRGYHLPGVGAFYSMDLSLPVVEDHGEDKQVEEEDRPRTEADREWERMRRRVLTGRDDDEEPGGMGLFGSIHSVRDRHWKLDESAVKEVQDEVLHLLARYGSRIEGLRSDESVTIALHLQGNSSLPLLSTTTNEDEEIVNTFSTSWSNIYASKAVAPVRVVIRVPVRALKNASLNGADTSYLRESARIHRY